MTTDRRVSDAEVQLRVQLGEEPGHVRRWDGDLAAFAADNADDGEVVAAVRALPPGGCYFGGGTVPFSVTRLGTPS